MSALLNSHNTLPCSMQGLSNTCMRGYRSTLSTLLILLLPEFMAQLLLSSVGAHSHTATGSCVIILDSQRLKYHLHKMRSDESPQHCLGFVLSGPINIFEERVCGEGKRTLLSTTMSITALPSWKAETPMTSTPKTERLFLLHLIL